MVQRCLCFLCCKSLLQGEFLLCGSQRGGGVVVKSLSKKAGGIPGRISVSSREGRTEALGLINVLFPPHLASAGIDHLHSSSHPQGAWKGAIGPCSAYTELPRPMSLSLPGRLTLIPPCRHAVPILVHEDKAGPREGVCVHMVRNSM